MSAQTKTKTNAIKSIIVCVLLMIFYQGICGNTLSLCTPYLLEDIQISRTFFATSSWWGAAVKVILTSSFVVFMKKFGFKKVTGFAAFVYGFALLAYWCAGKFFTGVPAYCFIVIQQLFQAVTWAWANTTALNIIVKNWVDGKQSAFFAILPAISPATGTLVSPLIAKWIAASGYLQTILVRAILAFVIGAIIYVLLKDAPDEETDSRLFVEAGRREREAAAAKANDASLKEEYRNQGVTFAEAKKSPQFYLVIVMFFLIGIVAMGPLCTMALRCHDIGMDALSGNLMSVLYAVSLIVSLVAGIMNDKLGTGITVGLFMIVMGLGYVFFQNPNPTATQMYLGAACGGVAFLSMNAPMAFVLKNTFGLKDLEKIQSAVYTSLMVSVSLANTVFSAFFDATGSYVLIYRICIAASVAMLAIVLYVSYAKIKPAKETVEA